MSLARSGAGRLRRTRRPWDGVPAAARETSIGGACVRGGGHGSLPLVGRWVLEAGGGVGAMKAGREGWEEAQHGEEQELDFPVCGIKASGAGAWASRCPFQEELGASV